MDMPPKLLETAPCRYYTHLLPVRVAAAARVLGGNDLPLQSYYTQLKERLERLHGIANANAVLLCAPSLCVNDAGFGAEVRTTHGRGEEEAVKKKHAVRHHTQYTA